MRLPRPLHSWSLTTRQAVDLQRRLAERVLQIGGPRCPRWIAGVDAAYAQNGAACIAGVVLWDRQTDCEVERHIVAVEVSFPYVPGLLSFREAPAVLKALRRLRREPDVILLDGHGQAHPRRLGLASHVGLFIDRPSIGCAKSLLVGDCGEPEIFKGAMTPLMHRNEQIGTCLRSREGVKPIYVSVGHRVSLRAAVRIALSACTRFRLPEPTRLADRLVNKARLEHRA